MANVIGLTCVLCGREEAPDSGRLVCPDCKDDGTLDVRYDMDEARGALTREALAADRDSSMWRYRLLLPLHGSESRIPLRVGGTPLARSVRLGETLGMQAVHVKDEGRNPSASVKDRGSAVALALALETGAPGLSCASAGNAASSLAALAAAAGIRAVLFVPESAPAARLAEILAYGAGVIRVRGSRDAAFDLAAQAVATHGFYPRSAGANPYLSEGKKTVAFEIAEGLGWQCPDRVYASAGDGSVFGSLFKGFTELRDLGLLDRIPKLMGVQAEGAAPLAAAFANGARPEPVEPRTFAESIAVGRPRDWAKALRAARESEGSIRAVSDDEIAEAMKYLARRSGIFAEPAAAAALAGLAADRREGITGSDENCVVIVGAGGLKDTDSVSRIAEPPDAIEPDAAALERTLKAMGLTRGIHV
jgi:threonine synthase